MFISFCKTCFDKKEELRSCNNLMVIFIALYSQTCKEIQFNDAIFEFDKDYKVYTLLRS